MFLYLYATATHNDDGHTFWPTEKNPIKCHDDVINKIYCSKFFLLFYRAKNFHCNKCFTVPYEAASIYWELERENWASDY